MLDVGELWQYGEQLRRVVLVAKGQRCMATLVESKPLARIQGDNAPSRIMEVLLLLPNGDDNASADPRHTLDTLDLGLLVSSRIWGAAIGDRIGKATIKQG